jgi:XTP/dITP diphosphohydrolase
MRELLIATTNENKLRELLEGFGELPFKIVTLKDFPDAGDVEETASTLEGNAIIKAFTYGKRTGKLTLAEDTGLEVDALGGRPGVHSARYAENDAARNQKLIGEMRGIPSDQRTARFRAVIAMYDPERNDRIATTDGVVEGTITEEARGEAWGYGPYFEIAEIAKTFGEISIETKNQYSHRARAAQNAKALFKDFI